MRAIGVDPCIGSKYATNMPIEPMIQILFRVAFSVSSCSATSFADIPVRGFFMISFR